MLRSKYTMIRDTPSTYQQGVAPQTSRIEDSVLRLSLHAERLIKTKGIAWSGDLVLRVRQSFSVLGLG